MILDEQTDLFQLAAYGSIDGVGRRTLRKVLQYRRERKWSWRDLWVPSQEVGNYLSLTTKQIESIKKSKYEQISTAILSSSKQHDLRLIGTESAEYPPLLKESDDPPPVLFVKGTSMEWAEGQVPIAIVGTRNLTAYGRTVTEKIAGELVDLGAVIISGLMYGADTIAHTTAVRCGGKTIAVLGYGFDHCYPSDHLPILDELLTAGATFVSEYPPWKIAKKGNFPARNSIVAGMSAAVVVTEAAAKSGSLITAQCAVDEGRAVCAVPGPITNPYCEGTKWLINEGATIVSSGSDVFDQLCGPVDTAFQRKQRSRTSTMRTIKQWSYSQTSTIAQRVYEALIQGPADMEQIAIETKLSQQSLLSAVTELELLSLITCSDGRWSVASI